MKRLITTLAAAALAAVSVSAGALELDQRRMLNAAEHVPWRGVGRVNVALLTGQSMCTGTLIREDLVLTAAHCVMSPMTGRPYLPSEVHFVAGWRMGQKVAHSLADAIAVHPAYVLADNVPTDRVASDVALVRLADPIPREKATFFDIAPVPDPETPLTLISYRRDRPHALTRQQGCELVATHGPVIQLGCSVTFGASGSPIFMGEGADARVVAVLAAMGTDAARPAAYAVAVEAVLPDLLALLK